MPTPTPKPKPPPDEPRFCYPAITAPIRRGAAASVKYAISMEWDSAACLWHLPNSATPAERADYERYLVWVVATRNHMAALAKIEAAEKQGG